MRILFIIAALETTSLLAHAQGTIWFGNNVRTRIVIMLPGGATRPATAEDNLFIGIFYGPSGDSADSLVLAPGLATIGPDPGILINAPRDFPLPGTEPGQAVFVQVRAWDAALGPDGWREARNAWLASPDAWSCDIGGHYYGQTRVSQFPLGPLDLGVGTIIWDSSPGGDPVRFDPLRIQACPEPSTMLLGALGVLGWFVMLRRRK